MKTGHLILAFTFSALALTACNKEEEEITENWANNTAELYNSNASKVTVTQGISGTLTLSEGNCMPIIDPVKCKEYPVKRIIAIYPYTTLQEVTRHDFIYFTTDAAPLITVESDAEGFYQASLAPGIYSVFVQEKGKLYANGTDGQGGINPVQVDQNRVSSFNLRIDYATH